MPGVNRVYTYRFQPPSDPLILVTAITEAADRVMRHNKHVLKVDTVIDGDDMLLRMTVHGHDQWWIKKNIVYPVAHILTKAGIKVSDVKLDDVAQLPRDQTWRDDPDRMPAHQESIKTRARQRPQWWRRLDNEKYLAARAAKTGENEQAPQP